MQIRAKGNETATRLLPDPENLPEALRTPSFPLCSPIPDSHQPAFCHYRLASIF